MLPALRRMLDMRVRRACEHALQGNRDGDEYQQPAERWAHGSIVGESDESDAGNT